MISGIQGLSYPVRLSKLNLPTLVYRRNRGDAILACKLMRANTLPSLFPTVGTNSRTRARHLKLVKQSTISRVCTQFLSSLSTVRTNYLMVQLLLNPLMFSNKSKMISGPPESVNSIGMLQNMEQQLVTNKFCIQLK